MNLSIFTILFLYIPFIIAQPHLTPEYYKQSCPDFQKIIREIVTQKQMTNPTTAAGMLRVFFHDCMVDGCDASVFISSNHVNKAERDSDINLSLPGDAFEVVVKSKTTLELSCPGIVSCSDIMAQVTRDLITMVGGPFYQVRLGRKDGLASKHTDVEGNLPRVNQTLDEIINLFSKKGFSIQEMVALTGGHTIGFSHCKEFANRLFHYSPTTPTDPEMHPKYADALKKMCANYTTDTTMSAFNDVMTPGRFDNMYYQNLQKGLGLLATDHALVKDPRTKPFVDQYAANQEQFFNDFARAMEKLSMLDVKIGQNGEIRRRCDAFNNQNMHNA